MEERFLSNVGLMNSKPVHWIPSPVSQQTARKCTARVFSLGATVDWSPFPSPVGRGLKPAVSANDMTEGEWAQGIKKGLVRKGVWWASEKRQFHETQEDNSVRQTVKNMKKSKKKEISMQTHLSSLLKSKKK